MIAQFGSETNQKRVISEMFSSSQTFDQFKNQYIDEFSRVLATVKDLSLAPFLEKMLECQQSGKKLVFFGNGGNAAVATHLAMGISYVSGSWKRPIRALSLSQDATVITSLANDWGYEHVFERQLRVMMEPGDVAVALSVSGGSPNVANALKYAKAAGNFSIAIVGHQGGEVSKLADFLIHVPHDDRLHGVTEDISMVLGHALCYYLEFTHRERNRLHLEFDGA